MRISFDHKPAQTGEVNTATYRSPKAEASKGMGAAYRTGTAQGIENVAYGFFAQGTSAEKKSAMEEMMQTAGKQDVKVYRDYMTVMSNTMSDEAFAKLQEEGYHPSDMEIEDAVTILDTIKAELIKAGVQIAGYTDTVDEAVLADITGSVAYAQQLVQSFIQEALPVTEENAKQAMDAFRMGTELTQMSEGAMKYMVSNQMEPQIENMYLAQHAGAVDAGKQGKGYFSEELPGYYAQKAPQEEVAKLEDQVVKFLEKAGYESNEKNISNALWMVEKGIPLTEQHFALFDTLKDVNLPAKEEDIFSSIAAAIAEGKPAKEADLTKQKSIYRRAAECVISYEKKYAEVCNMASSSEQITARRQLEEIRLHMTVEANVKLLKSGFAIDTAPIEEAIEALKQLENSQTNQVLSGTNAVDLCKETLSKTAEIPFMPAATLSHILKAGDVLTIDHVYETGKLLQESFKQAGEAYETMMTTPRADLGDNIKAAFRNVDSLLADMGQELTDENRKAVRSLSYNHMELNEENLLAVKGADKVVQRVVEKMTPSSVLKMIRDGIHPLETSMEELDQYLSMQDDYMQESTKYSRFLHNLEQNKAISPEEKESYIGIYRLLRQIEKSDGEAVGKLVSTGAEINFENLLSAVRTGKVKGIDVTVNGEFGGLKEAIQKGVSIDTQIDAAFHKQMAEEIRELSSMKEDPIHLLKQLELPVTADHLLAAEAVQKDGADSFKKVQKVREKTSKEGISFKENYADKESMQKVYEELIANHIDQAKEMTFDESVGSLDVREMQLACKQLTIQGIRAQRDEEYDVPMMIEGELTALHLKVVHDSSEKGKVSVGVDTIRYGYLSGEFSMEGSKVSGFFTGKGKEAVETLQKAAEQFIARLESNNLESGSIQVVEGTFTMDKVSTSSDAETAKLYQVAGMVIGAIKNVLQVA